MTARRLDRVYVWVTSTGDTLHGDVGDWLVEGKDGSRRTVASGEFRKMYEHLEGDSYRRIGAVTARRATSQEFVSTLEGTATAEPGSWVVSDQRGNSWPVPDEVFRETYEAIDE